MAFSVNNNPNTAGLFANLNNKKLDATLAHLATGSKLNNAADDAAAMAIANNFGSQVREAGQSIMNANDSIGMIQIADSSVAGISENMDKIRELALQASNATMNDASRLSIQKEIDGLMKSNAQIASSSSYNGISLLDGSEGSLANASAAVSGTIDVTSGSNLEETLKTIDNARDSLGAMRSNFGASQNQLLSDIRNTSVSQINAASAESNLRDIDFAQESANFNQQNLMSKMGSYVQAQQNVVAQNVTRLFQ
jgi:flagellin